MTRALVIRTAGDPEIAGAIVEGMTRRVIPLDDGQLKAVKAELVRYKSRAELRAYGDEKRFRRTRRELAMKYSTRPVGRLRGAFLGVYGLLILCASEAHARMNRGRRI